MTDLFTVDFKTRQLTAKTDLDAPAADKRQRQAALRQSEAVVALQQPILDALTPGVTALADLARRLDDPSLSLQQRDELGFAWADTLDTVLQTLTDGRIGFSKFYLALDAAAQHRLLARLGTWH